MISYYVEPLSMGFQMDDPDPKSQIISYISTILSHIVEGTHRNLSLQEEQLLQTMNNKTKIRLNHYMLPGHPKVTK